MWSNGVLCNSQDFLTLQTASSWMIEDTRVPGETMTYEKLSHTKICLKSDSNLGGGMPCDP